MICRRLCSGFILVVYRCRSYGRVYVRALFLAHKLLLVSFLSSFNKVFESEVERELLLRRLYHLFFFCQ